MHGYAYRHTPIVVKLLLRQLKMIHHIRQRLGTDPDHDVFHLILILPSLLTDIVLFQGFKMRPKRILRQHHIQHSR
ncbi:hypothetical protein D3C81_1524280 [compost metagenome]